MLGAGPDVVNSYVCITTLNGSGPGEIRIVQMATCKNNSCLP